MAKIFDLHTHEKTTAAAKKINALGCSLYMPDDADKGWQVSSKEDIDHIGLPTTINTTLAL
jgi:hypothetical protein